jgi:Nuclease-related domain
MGTSAVSVTPNEAGAHAQEVADRLRRRQLFAALGAVAVAAVAYFALGGHGTLLVAILIVALGAAVLVPRLYEARARPWEQGARGERKVGKILEGLGPEWHVIHGVWLGRGDIDHVLVGPAGTFTVETKSHRGRIAVDRVYDKMLGQAYAERKTLEKVSGLEVEALLVFSDAWLIGALPAHRRGVTILPARMLATNMKRRRPKLSPAEASEIAERLRLALEVDARLSASSPAA